MYRVLPDRVQCPAVGAPPEQSVGQRPRHYAMCSMAAGRPTQLCIRSSYTENAGSGKAGSAKAPTGMTTAPGSSSTV